MLRQNPCIASTPLIITLLAAFAFLGCEPDVDDEDNSKTLTIQPFHMPADGKLTEQQVVDYIVIRQKIIRDAKAQKLAKKNTRDKSQEISSGAGLLHFDEIEKAAANAFHMSYEEFLWIKDKIITIQTQLLVQRYYELNNRIMTLLDQTLTRYKETNAEKLGRQERQIMDGYVAEMQQEMTALRSKIPDSKEKPEALEHNIMLIRKFNKELEVLQQQALQSFTP